jgi:hypothetical protein
MPTLSHPAYRKLEQQTILVGLRRAGFPDP